MRPHRPSLLGSIVVHALVIGAAFAIQVPLARSEPPHEVLVQAMQPRDPVVEREPEPRPEEETPVEQTREEVPLREPDVEEIEPPEPEPVEERLAWTPPPPPVQWRTRIYREPEPPPEPVAEPVEAVAPPPAPVIAAIAGRNPPPEYPQLAVRRGWHGEVLLDVEVDEAGDVLECAVFRSSGFQVLDSAAVAAVRTWEFANGPGSTRVRVEFVLGAAGDVRQVQGSR